jgi:hypothetical protein
MQQFDLNVSKRNLNSLFLFDYLSLIRKVGTRTQRSDLLSP